MGRTLRESGTGISRHPKAIYHCVSASNVSIVKQGVLMVAALLIFESINKKKAALFNSFGPRGCLALFRFLSAFLCKHKLAVIEQTVTLARLNARYCAACMPARPDSVIATLFSLTPNLIVTSSLTVIFSYFCLTHLHLSFIRIN